MRGAVVDGKNGKDGKNGTNGSNGKDGDDGLSCTAEAIDDGYKIVCGDDSVGVVLNGAKGDKGVDGADGKSFVDGWMIDPRDKQFYRVVTIGEQIWMAENLNFATTGSYCYRETESDPRTEYCTKYGRLYTWEAPQSALRSSAKTSNEASAVQKHLTKKKKYVD